MITDVAKVIEAIANDIIVLAESIMDDDAISKNEKTGHNTLTDSHLKRDIRQSITNNTVIETFFNNYIVYLERERPPGYGKMPPISALREWALRRNIPTDNSTLFLIARAIQRDGHKARPILATLEKRLEENFNSRWYDELFNSLIKELIEYFN